MAEELGWLIERGDSEVAEPKYWAGTDRDPQRSSAWTSNHMEAIRFARRDDAEKVAKRALGGIGVRICDHIWADANQHVAEPFRSILNAQEAAMIDAAWLRHVAAVQEPAAVVINDNQPGWTAIIETKPNVTLPVGTKLYAAPPATERAVAEERERCVQVARDWLSEYSSEGRLLAHGVAAAIRAAKPEAKA